LVPWSGSLYFPFFPLPPFRDRFQLPFGTFLRQTSGNLCPNRCT
jgi:hypothetical protein